MRVRGNGLDGVFSIIMDKGPTSTSNYITIRKGSSAGANFEIVNELRTDGTWRGHPQAPAVGQRRTDAAQSGSAVLDPNSLYIGNSRYSYDMSNRIVQLHKLKDAHIPVYLQAHMSANDLPSGHGLEHMTINKWVDFARTHLSDDDLDVHDVFPYANADWDVADAPVPTLTAAYNAMSTDLTAAENDIDATEASIVRTSCVANVHVDASRTESYTETGTKHAPYKSLSDAMVAKLTDGATQTIIFKVKPGTYNVGSGIDIQQTALTQSFTVEGTGPREDVNIRCTDITTNVFYLRKFKAVIFKNVTIHTGKYGLYVRDTYSVQVYNCAFWKLGSSTSAAVHNFSNTQAEQAAHWAGSSTSDGGAMRLRSSMRVMVENCYVWRCLRGIRVQDIAQTVLNIPSFICNNQINETLESAIYLASNNYQFNNNGVGGCRHIFVTGNRIQKPYNNGLLVVGARFIECTNNMIHESANAGIQQYSSVDCVYKSNYLFNCNAIEHNGIGNLGDAWGNIVISGNTGITSLSGDKIATVIGNTTVNAKQGRAASVINIRLLDAGTPYPGSAYEFVADLNTSDAAEADQLFNPASETVVTQFYRKSEVDSIAALKQNTIADGDLTIAKTAGLQTALDSAGGGGGPSIRLLQQATDDSLANYLGNWGDAGQATPPRSSKFYQILTTDTLVLCYLDNSTTYNENEYPFLRLPLLSSVDDGHHIRVLNGTANGIVFVRTHLTDEPATGGFASRIVRGWASNGKNPSTGGAVEMQIGNSYRAGTFVRFSALDNTAFWFFQNLDTA